MSSVNINVEGRCKNEERIYSVPLFFIDGDNDLYMLIKDESALGHKWFRLVLFKSGYVQTLSTYCRMDDFYDDNKTLIMVDVDINVKYR